MGVPIAMKQNIRIDKMGVTLFEIAHDLERGVSGMSFENNYIREITPGMTSVHGKNNEKLCIYILSLILRV